MSDKMNRTENWEFCEKLESCGDNWVQDSIDMMIKDEFNRGWKGNNPLQNQ